MKRLSAVAMFVFAVTLLAAHDYLIGPQGPFFDPPEGVDPIQFEEDRALFTDQGQQIYLQWRRYPLDRYEDVVDLFNGVFDSLGAQGDGEVFTYQGDFAAFGDLTFETSGFGFRGYGVFVRTDGGWEVVLSYADQDAWADFHDFILSGLDSFAPDPKARLAPGPVSQYLSPFPPENPTNVDFSFGGSHFNLEGDPMGEQTSQDVIEREARVLGTYPRGSNEAWRRYYRVVYRDNYARLSDLAAVVETKFPGRSDRQIAEGLLAWYQSFEYTRTGTYSDLLSPVTCSLTGTGDCDALGLSYIILLNHMDIDAVLMVSAEYAHSMAAVAVDGPGARFSHRGREYVVAEMTESVDLGLIGSDVADPSKWLGVSLRY